MLVESFAMTKPSTKAMLALFAKLGVSDKKVLVLTDGVKPTVYLSTRNLQNAHVMPYSDASTYHVLWSDVVVIESSALSASTAAEA
jgi:large subunit ribosomal protein L4